MYLNRPARVTCRSQAPQRGSALLLALFIIVVMFVLGAGLTRILGSSSESITYEVYGVRAMMAAQTGAETVLAKLFPAGNPDIHCDGTVSTPAVDDNFSSTATATLDLSSLQGLENCTQIEVLCNDFKHLGVTYYHVTSRATCIAGAGSSALVVSRQVEIEAKSL